MNEIDRFANHYSRIRIMPRKNKRFIDFKSTLDFWKWESENGVGDKYQWPERERIHWLENECAFCHYYGEKFGCRPCYLNTEDWYNCCEDRHPYNKWSCAKTKTTRKKYAKILYFKILEYMEKEFNYKEK